MRRNLITLLLGCVIVFLAGCGDRKNEGIYKDLDRPKKAADK